MPREWTEEQKKAINLEGDLLVSAAAGAGKTAVLTERIVRLISTGVPVDRLLVVTFTNAAAAEMKERIEKRLRELAESESDPARAAELIRSAADCERANISTLHSFCMGVLRRHYHEAGLDPAFKVAETLDAELIAKRAVDEILEEKFASEEKASPDGKDAEFSALLTAVGNDSRLEELIRSLYDFAVSRPDPKAWLDMAVSAYSERFGEISAKAAESLVELSRGELRALMDEAKRLRAEDGAVHPGIGRALDDDMSMMLALMLQTEYDRWASGLSEATFTRLSFNSGTDKADKAAVNSYRDDLKNEIKRLRKRFSCDLSDERRIAGLLAPPIRALRALTDAFSERFASLKEEAGLIDFSDMEQFTLRVLGDPAVAEEYRERFHSVFVDEYQDINPAQEAILAAVSRGNRFMVGDVKQSIYRFRQAEPAIFMEKYRSYKGRDGRCRIDLNRNFRSRSAVLDAANLVFSQLMRGEGVGEIDYSDNAALVSGSPEQAGESRGSVELRLIDPGMTAWFDDEDDGLIEPEAAYAARRILEIMETGSVREGEGRRRYRFSDFAILLRSVGGVIGDWVKALTERGIPCVTSGADGFYEAVEVRLFMNILRIIDNRRQDIPLLAVMRSPVFGFTEDELAHIRIGNREGSVFDAVKASAADPASPPWSIKCARLLETVDRWREEQKVSELSGLMASILDETHLPAFVSALKGGAARARNLESLLSLAGAFSSGGGSLSGFIRFMDSAAEAAKLPASRPPVCDAVRIMTIHASKGLEFDTVILGDITRKFNRAYNREVGIFDSELGIGLCSVSGDTEQRSILQKAISAREASRLNAEEMRLLYVAMTRAKNNLILLGAKRKADEFAEKYTKPLNDSRIMHADFYADWLLGACFPNGLGTLTLPNGGAVVSGISGGPDSGGASLGMSGEAFSEWLQEADFLDTDAVRKRLSFHYPDEAATGLPSKLSVTGLTLRPAEIADRPRFMEVSRPFTGAEIGTLTHRLLQLVSIKQHTEESVRKELAGLTERGFFTEAEANAIRLGSVVRFFASELGSRLIASPRVEREREFDMLLKASELVDPGSDAPIMLQGVIDCCFIEDGEWVLVDHKTTHVDPNRTPRTVAERYRRQLELYALALERLTGVRVKERYVYLLSVDKAVRV